MNAIDSFKHHPNGLRVVTWMGNAIPRPFFIFGFKTPRHPVTSIYTPTKSNRLIKFLIYAFL